MAQFNPAVPDTNDPNWLGWSRSISQPEGDKTAAAAIETASDIGNKSINLADNVYKSFLDDQVHAAVDKERGEYTNTLQRTNTAVRSGSDALATSGATGATNVAQSTPLNILSINQDTPLPSQLGNLSETLSVLNGGKANGKLSETAYHGRMDALAKDLRSRYPGYLDYIDEKFEKYSGVNAANKYLAGMISDINSFTTNQQAALNKDLEFLRHNWKDIGADMPAIYAARQSGQIDANQMNMLINPRISALATFKFKKEQLDDLENDRKLQGIQANDAVVEHASKVAGSNLETITFATKEGQRQINDLILAHQSGQTVLDKDGNPITDIQWEQMGQQVKGYREATAQQLRTLYSQPGTIGKDGKPGRSIAAILGQDKTEALITQALAGHDAVANAIYNKETGTAFGTARLLEARGKGMLDAFYKQPGTGPVLTALKALNDAGGPQAVNTAFGKILTNGSFTPQDVGKLLAIVPKVAGQPDMRIPAEGGANATSPYTLGDALEDAKKNGGMSNAANKAVAALPNQLITDPKKTDELKLNVAKSAFSPMNSKYISKFEMDGKAPGKYSIFNDMLAPGVLKEVYRLREKDPSIWEQTKQWAHSTYSSELFAPEIRTLTEMGEMPGVTLTFKAGVGDQNPRWEVSIPKARETSPFDTKVLYPTPDMARHIQATVNRLNSGLATLSNVYKTEGSDPNAEAVKLFQGLGVKPTDKTVPGMMLNSTISSRAKPSTTEMTDRALPYDTVQTPPSGSLGEFLKSPGTSLPARKNNSPTSSVARPRGNLSDSIVTGTKTDDIPEGMSPQDFINTLK